MLVLSRKTSEVIVINNDIRIQVMRIQGGKVRLGIEASPDIPIHREEIQRLVDAELEEGK